MPKTLDLIAALSDMGGEYPETMFDDILGAYDSDVAELTAAGEVAATDAASALAAAQDKINKLTAHNYELLMSVDASDNAGGGAASAEAESEDEELDPDTITPDDLFGEAKDKE